MPSRMAHWQNLGRVMAETMQIDRVLARRRRASKFQRQGLFEPLSGKLGPGHRRLHAHGQLGTGDLAVRWRPTPTRPPSTVRSTTPTSIAICAQQRKDLYPGGLFGRGTVEGDHGDDQKTARLLTDFVRNGGRLGIVCDLYDRRGIAVPFFGKDAKTTGRSRP